MTDAHDRLKAERDAVVDASKMTGSLQPDVFGYALDALIEKAMALGAEPLVAALEANRKQLGLAYAKMKAYADPSAVRDTAKALDDADAALAATGKEEAG